MEKTSDEISEDEISDGGLKIVIESPKRKVTKKPKISANINLSEKHIIESIEKQFEETIIEKAAKSNLSTTNVKSILKQVVTNEHVIAMVRQTENPETAPGHQFEPKLTRAKAKELFPVAPVSSLPWVSTTQSSSEVQKLISDELAEDSSGDEYVPAEEESEDDRDSYVLSESELRSISPPTPVKELESPKQVHWTDDGIFKIPPIKTKEDKEEDANIALRTRSKLSLSATPLEVIEEAFIPPDITTDMYDMDCDDDVWCDFLTKFTRPLDEITKATEDEDHDPEYNILADEEVDVVDTEELRADKAVKVSRKELNDMLAELYEYASTFVENQDESKSKYDGSGEPEVSILESSSLMDTTTQSEDIVEVRTPITHTVSSIEPSSDISFSNIMQMDQKLLLEQQMRQHVQMLTQNYLLTYQHPEFHEMSLIFKESLINLKLLSGDAENSLFRAWNLDNALKLVENWEKQFDLNTDEIKTMKQHVCRVIQESIQKNAGGIDYFYIPTFPPLILDTITKSDVFIYPDLLPRIPFKSSSLFKRPNTFTKFEDELITLGLHQFTPYLAQDKYNLTRTGEVNLKSVCTMIIQYMLPMKNVTKLYCHLFNSKHPRSLDNPIKRYFENKRPSIVIHYVRSAEEFGFVAPCKRSKELLPHQWREYLHPGSNMVPVTTIQVVPALITKVNKPPAFNKSIVTKNSPKRRLAPKSSAYSPVRKNLNSIFKKSNSNVSSFTNSHSKGIYSSTPYKNSPFAKTKKLEHYFKSPKTFCFQKNVNSCVRCMKFNSAIFEKILSKKAGTVVSKDGMLPSMPFLGSSSSDNTENHEFGGLPSITSSSSKDCGANTSNGRSVEADSTIIDCEDEEVVEKDNEDDINALMIASSTIKSLARRGASGAEKKKAKLRREYSAALAMLSPEDPSVLQEKAQSYAQAYFDKARERLKPEEYEQFMEILNNFSDNTSSVSDLYKQMENILGDDHKELMDEFLTFLTPAQAKDIGKLIPYYMLSNMSLFLRKLEIYFKEQPAQLRKIYRSLTDLSTSVNVNMDRVKNTILPLLKGNSLLTDWFLQIFPCEPPPQSLLNGPWEHIDLKRDVASCEDNFETIAIPEVEDPYGGPNCICSCHQGEDLMFKSRSQHCTPCGIKFLQGRVYIQTGKGLRLANVTFTGDSDVDHNLRLNCSSLDKRKRRSDTSPSKQLTSPVKDCQEEVRIANDSEDDTECGRRKARITRSPRKKKVKLIDKPEKSANGKLENEEQAEALPQSCDNIKNVLDSIISNEDTKNEQEPLQDICALTTEDCDKNLGKSVPEEVTEWDCNTSIESTELKQSPEHSAESESEFCEESSQDNINTETDESAEEIESLSNSPVHSENSNSNTYEEVSWTRDEDKTILETLQKEGDKEETFVHISEVLGNRTIAQVKERFHTLMSLLQKMTSSTDAHL